MSCLRFCLFWDQAASAMIVDACSSCVRASSLSLVCHGVMLQLHWCTPGMLNIWDVTDGLIVQIMRHPGLVPLRYNPTFVAWIAVCLALSGLVLLFKTTTADPGFIPCGDSAHGTVSQGRKASPATSASRHGTLLTRAAICLLGLICWMALQSMLLTSALRSSVSSP